MPGRHALAAAVLCLGALGGLSAAPAAEPALVVALDMYNDGRHDEAVARALEAIDEEDLLKEFARRAPSWIGAQPDDISRRRLAAVSLALEITHARLDTHWRLLRDLVEWACAELRREPEPGRAALLWMQGTMALAGRGRATDWLLGITWVPADFVPDPATPAVPEAHLDHALGLFPDEPRFRLARVVAQTWGVDQERAREARWRFSIDGLASMRERRVASIVRFNALADDPAVGPEALVRAAQMYFELRELRSAFESARRAIDRPNDAHVRYLACFLIGRIFTSSNQPDIAMKAYEDALRAWPDAQAASLALAALQLRHKGSAGAAPRVAKALDVVPGRDDPWRLFGYGDFVRWPQIVKELRKELRSASLATFASAVLDPRSPIPHPDGIADPRSPIPGPGVTADPRLATNQQGIFRSRREVVVAGVSVKGGDKPITGLSADDFALYDNDVRQRVDAVTVETMPLDVTLFVDTSASTAGVLGRFARDVRAIAAMLGRQDRFRLVTIGLSVYESVRWQPAAQAFTPELKPVGGISLIYDALAAAMMHDPGSDRRHLIVGFTDGLECGSVVNSAGLLDISARAEGVVHIVVAEGHSALPRHGIAAWCTPSDPAGLEVLRTLTMHTGGELRGSSWLGSSASRRFAAILDEFRRSYVLQYSPEGVKPGGWHQLRVEVPKHPGYTVRGRAGYFAD